MSKWNNICIFTAATQPYADVIIDTYFTDINFTDINFCQRNYRNECDNGKNLDLILVNNTNPAEKTLIDDKLYNNFQNQIFYHIPPYNMYMCRDYEILKLCMYILWLNLSG